MLTEDYLMRMISQALAALLTAIGLKKAGKYSEALQAIEQAVEHLTTLPFSLIDQMEEAGLLSMLTIQDRLDTGRLAVLADLYQEAGEINSNMNRMAQAESAFARALRLQLEVVLAEEGEPSAENIGKIEYLYNRLKDKDLPVDTLLALSDHFQRLLLIDEQVLSKIGIDHRSINEILARLDRQISSS